jgi:RecJ-like exonuclease
MIMDKANNPDAVAPNSPGSGENLCRACAGTGRVESRACPSCGGSGKVTTPIGGA